MGRFSLASSNLSASPSPRFSAVGGDATASPFGTGSIGGTLGGVGGDIGGIATPNLGGTFSTSQPSFPFGAGLATPFGSIGSNLPPGLSLPASSGALGQGVTALTGSPMAGRFSNAALGGLPGVTGFAASEGARALGVPGFLSSLFGMLAGRAVPFGAPPIAGLGLANSLLGMGITTAQNMNAVDALNSLTQTGIFPTTDTALGRFSFSPTLQAEAQAQMNLGVPALSAYGVLTGLLGAPGGPGPAIGPDVNAPAPAFGPHAGVYSGVGLAVDTNPFSPTFGLQVPVGTGDASGGGGVSGGAGVGGPGAAGGPGSGGEGGNAP